MLPRLLWRCSAPLGTAAAPKTLAATPTAARMLSSAPPPPEKIECFVDGKKVLVDPGTTVLQVNTILLMSQ